MSRVRFVAPLCLAAFSLTGFSFGQGLKYERWNNLGSSLSVDALKSDGIALRVADVTSTTTSASAPSGVANNYGARLSGYVTAPATGDYTFYVQGDDQFELWISSDDTPFAKLREAFGTGWANTWDKFATQRTRTHRLVAGQRYYLEALLKEASGSDYLSIGWSYEPVASMTSTAVGSNVTQAWSESNGVISVTAEGGDIWGTADRFGFYHRAWTGDGEIIARVSELNNPYHWAKVGVMVRATLDANSAHATMVHTPEQGMAFQRRKTVGASSVNNQSWEEFQWVKLVRKGETITGYASVNGEDWMQVGTDTFPGLPQTVYVGLAASDVGSGTNPVVATVTNYAVRPLVATEVIPGNVLTPYSGHSDDSNGNHLPDVWENQQAIQGNAFAKSQYGDPDGDRVSNLQEYQTGNHPQVAQGTPGALFAERWLKVGRTSVEELVSEDQFFGPADQTSVAKTNTFRGFYVYDGVRLRGQITAPETGEYTFWVSSSGSSELWLSTDATKFQKRRIANLSPVVGTGHGIYSISSNRWDVCATQMSIPITLQAGQTYYLETLVQTGHTGWEHASIAWARPGKGREAIPLSCFTSYVADPSDADDDSLPDAWETQYGLSVTDNGLVERERQGQRGDFDQDGLSNHEEYLRGTNPANADTDGDGRNDADEARSLGTDPLQSDAPGQTLVGTVNLGSYVGADHGWTTLESGLLPHVFRGGIEWDINIPDSGTWIIEVATRARGKLMSEEIIPVEAAIDGSFVAREDLHYGFAAKALFRVLTPQLQPGTHRFRLFIDNLIARRTVQIESIKIYRPSGADNDEDNIPDWLALQMASNNGVYSHDATSRTSPAFIEGKVRLMPQLELAVEGLAVLPQRGLNNHHWYADIPLQSNEITDYAVSYGEGINSESSIDWEATNVLDGETLRIRKGDSLKIAATNGDSNATAQVDVFTDLRGWWELNETSGTVADDTTGREQDGTLVNGPLWEAGLSENALSFNGTSQYAQMPALNLSSNTATISAWVKRSGTQITWAGIAYTSAGGPSGIMFGANNQLRYNWNNLAYNFSSGLTVPDNQWTFCAVVIEPNKATLYMQPLGGSMQTAVNNIAHTIAPFSGSFYLGLDTNGPGRYFKGALDDVRVYSRALSATEVGQVAAAQAAGSGLAQVLTGDQAFIQTFNQAGVFHVLATHSSGVSGMLHVEVKQASFGAPIDMPGNRLKTWNLAATNVSPDLFFEAGDGLRCTKLTTSTASQTQLRLYPEAGGPLPVLARLWEGGPVVGRGEVNSILLSDALQNQMTSSQNIANFPGYILVTAPIGITNLPPGGKIVVVIQRAGVTFLDGTTRKEFTAEELASGMVNLEVLYPANMTGGYCHYIEIYDRNGVLVGTR